MTTGVLKANVGGLWTPVGPPGPQGPPGPPGPAAAVKAKGRAFTSPLTSARVLSANERTLDLGTPTLIDGFDVYGQMARALTIGRFQVDAHLTLTGGAAGNWMIFSILHYSSTGTELARYSTVASNVSTGYRMASVSATLDITTGLTGIIVAISPDTANASIDNRSWLSIAEVGW